MKQPRRAEVSSWRRRVALAVLLVGSGASLATSPTEDEVVGGEPVAGPGLVLDEGSPASEVDVVVSVDEPGQHGVRILLSSTGAAVLVSVDDLESTVVLPGATEPTEVSAPMAGCDDAPCEEGFAVRFELLAVDGPPASVTWSAAATTVVQTGDGGSTGSVEIGDPAAVAATASSRHPVLAGVTFDPLHAGEVALVRIAGPTAVVADLDARLIISTSGTPAVSVAVEVLDPVDQVPVLTGEGPTVVAAGDSQVVDLNVDGPSCDPAGECERIFWVLASQVGSGATIDVMLDVRGNSLEHVVLDTPAVERVRYDGPITFDAAGEATLSAVGTLPSDTSIIGWGSATDPSAATAPAPADVSLGTSLPPFEALAVPVQLEPSGAVRGMAVLGSCESPSPCPVPVQVSGPPSVTIARLVVELFAVAPAVDPIVGAVVVGG